MSLPTFKFTNFGAPTNNESANSGLSSASKMQKSGIIFDTKSNILSDIREKAQDTFKDVKMPSIDLSDDSGGGGADDDSSSSFFSIGTFIKFILIVVILWFMWSSLSNNGDFHLGMGEFGDKINVFFKSMEEKGRELISRMTNTPMPVAVKDNKHDDSDSDSDSDSDDNDNDKASTTGHSNTSAPHRPPVPPGMTNSSDKKPGFINDETKYTFLDKADRSYTGPAPRADDSTSVTQKHQTGKGGYCYIGEDRGFRSCVKVEASDKCMSGQVFSRQDICVDPTLRE
jgi:hypothetical protein